MILIKQTFFKIVLGSVTQANKLVLLALSLQQRVSREYLGAQLNYTK
jgi:hypothetical protein